MEVFARVVEKGGFSAAARSLDLTPSAVSKLIGRLEARLGARLFVRTTRALLLTEEGQAYHRAAVRIVQDLNEADQTLVRGGVRGRLCISSSIPFGRLYVAPTIPSFSQHHPDVIVDLNLIDQVIDLVAQRTDIAIRTGNLPVSGLMARKLAQSRMVVCAAPSYLERRGRPRKPTELKSHDCLKFNFRRSSLGWPFLDAERELQQPVAGNLEVNNGETMRELALAGAGIARLAVFHVAADLQAGRLLPVLEPYNPGDLELVHAVYVGGGNVPQRVRSFIDHLVNALSAPLTFEMHGAAAPSLTRPKGQRPKAHAPRR